MAAIMLQTIPSFYAKVSEKISFLLQLHIKNILFVKSTAHHDGKMCFLPVCKYHTILLGEIEELLHNLDTFCSTYQYVDCLSTLFKYRFSENFIAESENVFDIVQRAICFNQKNRGVKKMPSFAKKRLVKKSVDSNLWVLSKRTNQRRPVVQCFTERIEKAKKIEFELELIKIQIFFLMVMVIMIVI